MITVVTGKIGGGKTYWAVNYLIKKFFIYQDELFQYIPRSDVVVISNIRDLEIEHRNLKTEIDKLGIEGVFSPAYVQSKSCVFIIDEAQQYFDRKFYNKNVFGFFQMSRHYGVDVILITQDIETLSKELRSLYEYEIKSIARSQRLKNTFVYKYIVHDEVFKRQAINFDKKIGNLYRSQFRNETESVPRIWGKFLIIGLVCIVVALFGVSRLINLFKSGKETVISSKKPAVSREMTNDEILQFKNDLSKTPDAAAANIPDKPGSPGVSRLWNGQDTLTAAYDKENDISYYVLKESGVSVGYVKVPGEPKHISGLSCSLASVICDGQFIGSKVESFCNSCNIKLKENTALAPALASGQQGKKEDKKGFGLFDKETKPLEKK
jgi:hypothetical protein